MSWRLKEFERAMFTIFEVIEEDGEVIKTFVADQLTYSEKKKKAQLIAAAPELLEVVEESLEILSKMHMAIETTKIHKAINKAKGVDE